MSEPTGIIIDEIGGACPVQAWGTFHNVPFYFRARGSSVTCEVGETARGKQYHCTVVHDEDTHRWTATAEDLPGCIAEGDTVIEALDNLRGVTEAWIEAARSLGQEIPQPPDEEPWVWTGPEYTWPFAGYITLKEAREHIGQAYEAWRKR